jgi:high-affinity iron transporter
VIRSAALALALLLLTSIPALAENETDPGQEADSFASGLSAAAAAYAEGDALAAAQVGDLFYEFEESGFRDRLAAADQTLYKGLETEWLAVRRLMKSGAPAAEVDAQAEVARTKIQEAKALLGVAVGTTALFFGSFLLIFREGFEALLVIGALAAYLRKSQRDDRVRDLYLGAGAAVVASLALWALAKTVIEISGAQAEMIEGVTLLVATVVLFYVSHWLVSKAQAAKWEAFVRRQMQGALAQGGRAAFLGVAFLVVFREGFETVLFYEALAGSAPAGAATTSSLVGGFLVGAVVLAAVYGAISFLGMKLPMSTFFGLTGALLYLMAFKFAGDGMRELQEAGALGETVVGFVPASPLLAAWLGIHPFLETLAAQVVLVVAVAAGLAWTFRARAVGEPLAEA